MSRSETKATIAYRTATPDDLPALITLKGKMDGLPAAREEWVKRWPWQFVLHPWRRNDCPANSVVALLEGRIAGAIGWMPARLTFAGREIESAFACELFIDPDAQGHGIGQALIDQVVLQYPDSLYMNTPPAGARSYDKRGFTRVEPVQYRMLPVQPGRVLAARGHRLLGTLLGWTGVVIRSVTRAHSKTFKRPEGVSLGHIEAFTPEFDHFDDRRAQPDVVRPRRNAAYLRWRYQACPFGPYRSLVAKSGNNVVGYAVYRTKPTHNGTQGLVNELEADRAFPGLAEALLAWVLDELLNEKVDLVMAFPTEAASLKVFRKLGFLDARRTPHLHVAPGSVARHGFPTDGTRWAMSLGDCDLDYF